MQVDEAGQGCVSAPARATVTVPAQRGPADAPDARTPGPAPRPVPPRSSTASARVPFGLHPNATRLLLCGLLLFGALLSQLTAPEQPAPERLPAAAAHAQE